MGISSVVQCSSSKGMVWKSSSSSLSKRYIGLGGVDVGDGAGELNESLCHTGLVGVCGGHCGVVSSGLKEACSRVET